MNLSLLNIQSLARRPFLRNVAILAGGTAASQIIAMAVSPILTRLYGPEAYGAQGVFMTVVNILSTVAALSYPLAIALPRKEAESIALIKLSLVLGLLTSNLTVISLFLWGEALLAVLNAQQIADFKYLLPIATMATVIAVIQGQWLIREKAFSLTSRVGVIMALITAGAKTGAGFLAPTALTLILTNVLTGIASSVFLFTAWSKKRDSLSQPRTAINWRPIGLGEVFTAYRDFAVYRTPQALLSMLSQSLPVIFLSVIYGAQSVGFYSLAATVLAMPAAVIGGSVMQVFLPRFNDALHDGENIRSLLLKATGWICVVGVIPFGVIILFGAELFGVAFGKQWVEAGQFSAWLSIGLFCAFINRPCLGALSVLRKQEAVLIFEFLGIFLKISGLYAGFLIFKTPVASMALFSILTAISNLIILIYGFRVSSKTVAAREIGSINV